MKVIFFKRLADVPDGATKLSLKAREFRRIMSQINRGEVQELYIPPNMVEGYCLPLDCEVEFRGEFTQREQAQAMGRFKRERLAAA